MLRLAPKSCWEEEAGLLAPPLESLTGVSLLDGVAWSETARLTPSEAASAVRSGEGAAEGALVAVIGGAS